MGRAGGGDGGKAAQEGKDICIHRADSLHHTAGSNRTL